MDLEFGSKFVTKPMKARVPSDAGWELRIWGLRVRRFGFWVLELRADFFRV